MDSGQQFLHETRYATDMPEQQSDQDMGLPQPPLELPPDAGIPMIALPDPKTLNVAGVDLRTAIDRRHSCRLYRDEPLSLEELSYLLWCTQGVKAVTPRPCTLRTVPSGGARHAFETYLMVRAVTGLEPGIYRFLAIEHALQLVMPGTQTLQDVTQLCSDQKMVELSAVTFIWTAVPYRMVWRYNQRAYRALFLDAGHVCQNLYLAAEAIDCGVCAIAAFLDDEFNTYLGFDPAQQFVIYCASLGKKPAGSHE
ncbi:MAG: SagB/ThcOx family dehydrogenase [Caldiserica bacterium]|nr:SagB/ThcOx family dehydrogenase [Caldisericota bacterium]